MTNKLIILPQPILVSDEKTVVGNWAIEYQKGDVVGEIVYIKDEYRLAPDIQNKIIAGIEGLPKLDLSAIAKKIGWVDVENLAQEYAGDEMSRDDKRLFAVLCSYGRKLQSLNEKKFSEKDLYGLLKLIGQQGYYVECDGTVYANAFDGGYVVDAVKEYSESQSKPKEYNVVVEMEDKIALDGHTLIGSEPKITNNTIKILRIT